MSESFKPIDHLTEEEKELHKLTRERIINAINNEELEYYKKVLDVLLSISFSRREE